MQKSFGSRLRELRGEFMQVELAHEFGVGQSAYSAWELDKKEPSLNTIRAMCRFFKITADELLGIEPETPVLQASKVAESKPYDSPHAPTCSRCKDYRDEVAFLRETIRDQTAALKKDRAKTPSAQTTGANAHAG